MTAASLELPARGCEIIFLRIYAYRKDGKHAMLLRVKFARRARTVIKAYSSRFNVLVIQATVLFGF